MPIPVIIIINVPSRYLQDKYVQAMFKTQSCVVSTCLPTYKSLLSMNHHYISTYLFKEYSSDVNHLNYTIESCYSFVRNKVIFI